jgi:predicted ATPase
LACAAIPGLGKSRLAWEFRRLAEPRVAVLEGRCLSYGPGIAYLPLYDLVRRACGAAPTELPDRAVTKIELKIKALELDIALAHYLCHAFGLPTGDPAMAQLDPQTLRARTFDALRRLLIAEARPRPLVVLVEDLHWIDRTSEEFLAEFAEQVPLVPLMLLVTYRAGYAPPWTGKPSTSQLALRPLPPAASEQIVASVLGRSDPAAAAAIAARGEGNPFFLEELARVVRDQATDAAGVTVPVTIQQVLAARIDRLSADQKAAIQVAAVLGREVPLNLAGDIWDAPVPLPARLEELTHLDFLYERRGAPERTFVFKHALTREVAYDTMLHGRRRELHGRAGAALEQSSASQRFEHCELLAYHYSHSASLARAVPYLAAAGDRAKDRYANQEAIAFYRQAITLIEELDSGHCADDYRAVCEGLGAVLGRLSQFDAAINAYRKALAVARSQLQEAHLHVRCSEAETGAHRYQKALAECDLAEQALGPTPDPPDPQWLSAWLAVQEARMRILYWLNDTEEYARLIGRVRPYAEAHGSAEQRAGFLDAALLLSFRLDRFLISDQTMQLARAGLRAAKESESPDYWWGRCSISGSRWSTTETWTKQRWCWANACRRPNGAATPNCARGHSPTSWSPRESAATPRRCGKQSAR